MRDGAEAAPHRLVGPRPQPRPDVGVGDRAPPRRGVEGDDVAPPGEVVEHAVGAHAHEVGERQGDDVRSTGAGVVARRELLLVHLGGRQAAEEVPVERSVRGERHVGHELDAVAGDLAHRGDELERCALVVAHRGREREQLLPRRGA